VRVFHGGDQPRDSKLSGVKFANGAVTGAFQYLINCVASKCNAGDYLGKKRGHAYEPFSSPVLCYESNHKCIPAAIREMACHSAKGQPGCVPIRKDAVIGVG
jgi:hypothetical protein